MKQVGKGSCVQDQQGAVYVEFLVVFLVYMLFLLCLVQWAFIQHARVVVERSANAAVRSARVVLPDANEFYSDGEHAFEISQGDADFGDYLLWSGLGRTPPTSVPPARLGAIRTAAGYPLLSIPAPMTNPQGGSLAESNAEYLQRAMALVFPAVSGSTILRRDFIEGDDGAVASLVTTRVTYLFTCSIPLANKVMCRSLSSAPFASDFEATGRTLPTQGQHLILSSEATLPLASLGPLSGTTRSEESEIE